MQLIGPKSKVLITGATGFLGSHLALALLKEGNSSLVCLARGKRDSNARDRVAKALESAWSDSGENGPFDAFLASRGDDLAIWETDLEALEGMDPALSPVKSCDEIWHLAAKVDSYKSSAKSLALYAVLGLLGAVAGTAILATAGVLLVRGDLHFFSLACADEQCSIRPRTLACHGAHRLRASRGGQQREFTQAFLKIVFTKIDGHQNSARRLRIGGGMGCQAGK